MAVRLSARWRRRSPDPPPERRGRLCELCVERRGCSRRLQLRLAYRDGEVERPAILEIPVYSFKAFDAFLAQVGTVERLHRLNSDILIEFRQGYIGPAMRKYGNMFRAVDCPNSIGDNRVRTLDVRLLSGDTAVHSDPITWHDDDPPESAAMQLLHALFSAPQISRKLSELTPVHMRMLKSYLRFWRRYREVLMTGELAPLYPHLLYPLVTARTSEVMVAAFYANTPLACSGDLPAEVVLVNGTYKPEILIDASEDLGTFEFSAVDCLGKVVERAELFLARGIQKITVPAAGHALLTRKIDPTD